MFVPQQNGKAVKYRLLRVMQRVHVRGVALCAAGKELRFVRLHRVVLDTSSRFGYSFDFSLVE